MNTQTQQPVASKDDNCSTPVPACPQGHAAKHVHQIEKGLWYCHACKMQFDDSGDDGDIGYGRPERQAERQERRGESRRVVFSGSRLGISGRRY